MPVVLGLNYEAHNAPAYRLNNSARDIPTVGKRLSVLWLTLYAQKLLFLSFRS